MALDRPYDDGATDAPLERRAHRGGSDAHDAVTIAEPRTRLELRALLEAMDMPTDPIAKLNVQG